MIYTAVKKFDRALYFYETVISTPAMAVSHVMLEAYKKYILVSLILYGKVCIFLTLLKIFVFKLDVAVFGFIEGVIFSTSKYLEHLREGMDLSNHFTMRF